MKGRAAGADTVTVTRNEILTALNKPGAFVLALVAVSDGAAAEPRYVRRPFAHEPDFGATSVTYRIADLSRALVRLVEPPAAFHPQRLGDAPT